MDAANDHHHATIARMWRARAAGTDLAAYRTHLEANVFPVLRGIAGYAGARLLTRPEGDEVEILVVTWWRSLETIRAFAGADVEQAVVDPEVRPLFSAWDERVRHYEIALRDEP
jgi:heme-degrading monooxygenase HmoA